MKRYFPILTWAPGYDRQTLTADLIAAVIVTLMLIPQSLAYALLAGLPAEVGLYASIAPLVLYAVFGTSRTLAVGPVAVASLMTATAVGEVAARGTPEYLTAAILLAVISGVMLLAMGVLRLGFLANFLSHPVIAGFITAAGLLIAASQVKHVLGIRADGETLVDLVPSLLRHLPETNPVTLVIGAASTAFLFWARKGLKRLLLRLRLPEGLAAPLARTGPVLAIIAATLAAWQFDLAAAGVALVGDIPRGLPALAMPSLDPELWRALAVPALLISIVGYVETVAVAQTLAARRRQRIDPDQELIALGASNIGAGLSGGFPVTGGFARSVVNFDAGAQTPAAGAFTAVGMALAVMVLTPALSFLPTATLAATIIVAVLGLVDLRALPRTWAYSRPDAVAMAATIALTLAAGVEAGIVTGVALSLAMHLWRTSRPHVAVVGQVPGTEHFRNVERHAVVTAPHVLTIRVDESLYFPNARFLEDLIAARIAADPAVTDVVLMATAVNEIDASALESLEAINARLRDAGLRLHLSEVKGPVMDRLKRSHLLGDLTGRVFLTQYDAFAALAPDLARATRDRDRCETARPWPRPVRGPGG